MFLDSSITPPRKISQTTDKDHVEEAYARRIIEEEDINTL
jgi:hypothetical protein